MTKASSNQTASKPNDYSDIINLPRPISKTRPHMSKNARAAQFAPYAALVGHHDLIAHEEQIATTKDNLNREIITELDLEVIESTESPESFDNFPASDSPGIIDLDFNQENPLDS